MTHKTGPAGSVVFFATAFLIVVAPLIRGGNRPLALLILELAGLICLAVIAWQVVQKHWQLRLPRSIWLGVALLVGYPLLQLVPLPAAWWAALPGRDLYAQVLDSMVPEWRSGLRPMTIHAAATLYSWLVLLPCLAVFLAVQTQPLHKVRKLVVLFVAVATTEAILGILQVGGGAGSWLYLGNVHGGGAATGTYVNRNHFAALIEMALPVALVIWAATTFPQHDRHGNLMLDHPDRADLRVARRILWSCVLAVLILALLMTRSRAGIGCGLLVFALAGLHVVGQARTRGYKLLLVGISLMGLLMAGSLGLTPILDRLAADELGLGLEGRWRIALAALAAGHAFLPFGSGLGTFADIYPQFQGIKVAGYVDHAHNDYIEAYVELGLVGVAILGLFAAALGKAGKQLWQATSGKQFRATRVSAGLGMLAILLHGMFDFNFHVPANAIYFSLLAGILFLNADR